MTIERLDRKLLNFASHIDENTIAQANQTASMPFVHPHVALIPTKGEHQKNEQCDPTMSNRG